MISDILCLLRYGRTRFGLMECYKISVKESLMGWRASNKDGYVAFADTPEGALISCVELIRGNEK